MKSTNDYDWNAVEVFIEDAFRGQKRKTDDPAVEHSRNVGQMLREQGRDAITVFGGYTHDVLEDTEKTYENVLALARQVFGNEDDAVLAAELSLECCYTDAEYTLPKKERKATACARWIASENPRVAFVKMADVSDNRRSAPQVSAQFEAEYLSWAQPLFDALEAKVAALTQDCGPA